MTEATTIPPSTMPRIAPDIYYQVAMYEPESHLFDIMLKVRGWRASVLDLKMPVWTPGSYLVREYAKHLQEFSAEDANEIALPWRKISKNHWQIETPELSEIIVRYRIYANELSVRTNHLDSTHGYLNGAALFFISQALKKAPSPFRLSLQNRNGGLPLHCPQNRDVPTPLLPRILIPWWIAPLKLAPTNPTILKSNINPMN
jgi:predicted metalloprotease with PDZ domain